MDDFERYKGREPAYVKHYFLENYLERLVHKTAGKFDHIVYVDGFSGPWQSAGEDYKDTSFGIALSALRKAKGSWSPRRIVKMTAHLVEKNKTAYAHLTKLQDRFPDITIHTYNDDFVALAAQLRAKIPSDAFLFALIDPKGWKIDIKALSPLLARPNSEFLFNFMFDFINRAASIEDPKVIDALALLIPEGDWRDRLRLVRVGPHASIQRKGILVEAFSDNLRTIGGYDFVAETPVFKPLADRTLYSLIYGTRKPAGIEVFRDCQVLTLDVQDDVRGKAKIDSASRTSGQGEMFGTMSELAPRPTDSFLVAQREAAAMAFLKAIPESPGSAKYIDLWPRILEKHVIRRVDLNQVAAALKKAGAIQVANWAPRQRVPQDPDLLSRPSSERVQNGS